jgi:predicted nucleotidyltransferase
MSIVLPSLERAASAHAGLNLLLLHGSRARGDAHAQSDWDFGYVADDRLDPEALRADLVRALGSEHVDLVDLDRASAQLRFRAARDGRVVYSLDSRQYPRFWHKAVTFWCEAGPVLRRGYADLLDDLAG